MSDFGVACKFEKRAAKHKQKLILKKKTAKYILITLIVSLSIPLLDIITVRFDCDYLGDTGPGFYGFPFKYRTSIPWVNTMSGVFYISGFLCNILFYCILILSSILTLKRIIASLIVRKVLRITGYVIAFILLPLAILNFMFTDWKFEWKDTYYKNYGGKPLECEKHFEFFYISNT